MRNKLFLTAVVGAIFGVVGCETEKVSEVGPQARQAISAAATSHYPGNPTTSEDIQVAAVTYPEKGYLEIHNLGDQSIPRSTVWVNGAFMSRIEAIAPKSVVKVKYGNLLEAGPATNDLKRLNQPVAKVELETDRGLYSVQGPTIKHD